MAALRFFLQGFDRETTRTFVFRPSIGRGFVYRWSPVRGTTVVVFISSFPNARRGERSITRSLLFVLHIKNNLSIFPIEENSCGAYSRKYDNCWVFTPEVKKSR